MVFSLNELTPALLLAETLLISYRIKLQALESATYLAESASPGE